MAKNERPGEGVDWRLTTWEGARREQLRRWAALPLERILLALEEMQGTHGFRVRMRTRLERILLALEEMQEVAERLSQPGPVRRPAAILP